MKTDVTLAAIGMAPMLLAGIVAAALCVLGGVRALAADTNLIEEIGDYDELPVKASAVIYKGGMVGLTSSYARPLTAGDQFGGHAFAGVIGTAADGGVTVRVKRGRYRLRVAITSAAVTDVGKRVYASDDGTYTLTASTNTPVGKVVRWVSTGIVIVEFDAPGFTPASALLTALTHTAPGTPDYAIQDLVNSSAYGFVTKDEGNSVLKVLTQLQATVAELVGLN